mgnify:CR=1 FL=1
MGNPPFVGYSLQTGEQKEDILKIYVDEGTLTLSKAIFNKYTTIYENPTLTASSNNTTDASGLYKSTATNDGSPTYYFRGNVTNNYVDFAGFTWRIVRINEDGSVRLILDTPISVNNTKDLPVLTLPELGEFGRGVSKHRPRNAPELLGGKYPLIQTGEVANSNLYITEYENTYSELGFKQSKLWQKGTLCITIAANIAKTAILTFDACFPDSVVGFKANDKTNNIFIHYYHFLL